MQADNVAVTVDVAYLDDVVIMAKTLAMIGVVSQVDIPAIANIMVSAGIGPGITLKPPFRI